MWSEIRLDGGRMRFTTIEEMAKNVAEKALDEYEYEGKTIRQWTEILKDYDDKQTTLQRIMERLEEKAKEYTNDDLSYRIPWFGIEEAIEVVKEEGGIE